MVKVYIVGGKKGKRKRKPIRVDFSALSHGRDISIKYTLAKALGMPSRMLCTSGRPQRGDFKWIIQA